MMNDTEVYFQTNQAGFEMQQFLKQCSDYIKSKLLSLACVIFLKLPFSLWQR